MLFWQNLIYKKLSPRTEFSSLCTVCQNSVRSQRKDELKKFTQTVVGEKLTSKTSFPGAWIEVPRSSAEAQKRELADFQVGGGEGVQVSHRSSEENPEHELAV